MSRPVVIFIVEGKNVHRVFVTLFGFVLILGAPNIFRVGTKSLLVLILRIIILVDFVIFVTRILVVVLVIVDCVRAIVTIFCIGVIVQITTTKTWYQISLGRWVAGLGVGGLSVLTPMYQSETAPRYVRGALVSCYQLFITLGIFTAYCEQFYLRTISGTYTDFAL